MPSNFNYIAFGNRMLVEGEINSVRMGRGRLFEYTPPDVAKGLEPLDKTAVEFIESQPTFLCSEVAHGENSTTIFIKYGRVSDINIDLLYVTANFQTLADFGEVEFEDLQAASVLFDADHFQLYRTHWAVRNGSAADVLHRLAKRVVPNLASLALAEAKRIDEPAAGPPTYEKDVLGTATSIEEFLTLISGLPDLDDHELFFRGHADESYELTPSLLRRRANGDWIYMPREDRLCKDLLIAHHDEFQDDRYCFDRLVRMQHYGLPTRLLDISGNPLVALFFACEHEAKENDPEGEVIVVRVPTDSVKYYDSDTVSCLSNLSNLTFAQKNDLDLNRDLEKFRETKVAGKLLHHIKAEKGYFEPKIVPNDLRSIICVRAKQTNSRIKSQDGAFLLFGHEATLPDAGTDEIKVSRAKIKNKRQILKQLDRININATSVYPSIGQTAKHLRDRHRRAELK